MHITTTQPQLAFSGAWESNSHLRHDTVNTCIYWVNSPAQYIHFCLLISFFFPHTLSSQIYLNTLSHPYFQKIDWIFVDPLHFILSFHLGIIFTVFSTEITLNMVRFPFTPGAVLPRYMEVWSYEGLTGWS